MDLKEARNQIDALDAQLTQLLVQRFDICCQVARIKAKENLPVLHPAREDEVAARAAQAGQPYGEEISQLFRAIMKTSVDIQEKLLTKLRENA